MAAHYSPEGSLRVNDRAAAVGRSAIAAVAQAFMTAFPDMKIFMDELFVEEERTFYHWTLTGTNTGAGGKGKRVRISGFEEWRMDADGLIAESRGHFDQAEYQRQLEYGIGNRR